MTATSQERRGEPASVAIAVVCISGAVHLERCLGALQEQEGGTAFEVFVCHDPLLAGIGEVVSRFPATRVVSNPRQRSPHEMAATLMAGVDADVVLLTEDHCLPCKEWVRCMLSARAPGRAAIGGRVECAAGASALDWAFYFVDFFRYAAPVAGGPAATVSVCNAVYDRDRLVAVSDVWRERFRETEVHEALRARFGALWMEPGSEVTMRRSVSFRDAMRERYAFGRQFACSRAQRASAARRWTYAALAPVLPVVLLGRMAAKAMRSPRLAWPFVRALAPLVAMVVCWSFGEWVGYVTGRPPGSTVVAQEVPS